MSKKKKDNLILTTELNKQILFPITQEPETKIQDSEKLTKSSWERLRRNPQYLKLCEGIDFMKNGLVELTWYVYH